MPNTQYTQQYTQQSAHSYQHPIRANSDIYPIAYALYHPVETKPDGSVCIASATMLTVFFQNKEGGIPTIVGYNWDDKTHRWFRDPAKYDPHRGYTPATMDEARAQWAWYISKGWSRF